MAWDDDDDMDFNFDDLSPEENEELGKEIERERKRTFGHPLMKKATEIYKIVHTLNETVDEEDRERYMGTMYESAIMLAPKIAGAMGSKSWQICMQNAAIIRYHAEYIRIGTNGLKVFTKTDPSYIKMLRSEMEEFRELFKAWVKTFDQLEQEDYEDEWGLFVRK